jgi:hypothetical protein
MWSIDPPDPLLLLRARVRAIARRTRGAREPGAVATGGVDTVLAETTSLAGGAEHPASAETAKGSGRRAAAGAGIMVRSTRASVCQRRTVRVVVMLRTSSPRLSVSQGVRHPVFVRAARCGIRFVAPALAAVFAGRAPAVARAESPLAASLGTLAHDLGAAPRRALVVASPLGSDIPAPRGDELSSKVAALVAGALGGEAAAEPRPMDLAAARARSRTSAGKVGAIVYLDVRVTGGELRVTADVYPVAPNGWDRVRLAPSPPTSHAYVHAPVTAEVRAYLAPVRLDRATLKKFTHGEGRVLALACGDLDGQSGNDLVVVSDRDVSWGYLEGGRFVTVRRAAAATLGPRAAVPWREPFASAYAVSSDGAGTLFVGWSDRADVTTGPDLAPRSRLAGLPLMAAATVVCSRPSAAHGAFESPFVGCDDGKPLASEATVPALLDAFAEVDLVGADGHAARFLAAREPSETLHVTRVGGPEALTVHDVGAQLALADLDQDGVPEVITTTAHGEDALIISSLREGALVPRLRFAAPAGVDAVAICPAEADDAPSVVAAVGAEIWLVH